jgi:FtsP/CotA-like multicopper oxidase with cupredoxin domain
MDRRQFLLGTAGAAALAAGGYGLLRAPQMFDGRGGPIDLRVRETAFAFGADRPVTQGLVSLADGAPPPVIRLKQGVPAHLRLTNGLADYTTMHWHGIRLPNAMDGVPYLTQFPVGEGEVFDYVFTPPDAGTYWYHPHCMTMRQMAQGLTGVLVVEEADDIGFDLDLPLNLKDFRLGEDGQLLPYFTPRGAARAGTLGNVLTTNWAVSPVHDVPAGGLVRLRLVATDTTRLYRLSFPDLPGRIIAWDGHPVTEDIAWPTAEAPLVLAPGQRVDVALRMPDDEGAEARVMAQRGFGAQAMVTLRATGRSAGRDLRELTALPRNPVAVPDLSAAETHELVFGWTPDGSGSNNGLCGSYAYSFWSIDRTPWPGDAVEGAGPVATLKLGQSYVLRLRNESPNAHPIHLHGLVFTPIRSNQRRLPANVTDTVLLQKNEVVDVALVADNPGDWAFHCHVIEHQKTGLAGFVRVV